MKYILAIFFMAITISTSIHSQNLNNGNFFDQIKKYDVSSLWTPGEILIEDSNETSMKPEPLGFIGDDYFRFFIHFISVIQNRDNPYQYFIYGKTKLRDNVCAFEGTMSIIECGIYESSEAPGFKQGHIRVKYEFYEDNKQKGSGKLTGFCLSHFLIDKSGKLRYDALMCVADGFSNNEFRGTWESYKTKESKSCNWGDYRIPDSGPLDVGVGEFMVTDKFVKNGWENFYKAWETNDSESKKAQEIEEVEWWK